MKLTAESVLPFPRELVYRTYRDRLADLVPYLPNVRKIEVTGREEEGSVVRFVNIWHGGGEIPKAARAVLSEKMLSWTDYARWDESQWICDWRSESHSFKDVVNAQGQNRFVSEGNGCRLIIGGDLTIDARKLPVPRLLAASVGSLVESFLVAQIKPNLLETAKGLTKFLQDEAKR